MFTTTPGRARSHCISLCLFGLAVYPRFASAAYTAEARWGQATALVNSALFVHGGKTDPQNAYSYTSAPNSNDVLFLNLSSPFSAAAPAWELVGACAGACAAQAAAPPLAWHTLAAFSASALLLFGGDPGPNAPPAVATLPDSALLVGVADYASPAWVGEPQGWAGEPVRRIHHSAASAGGRVWLVGGMKDDGSDLALADHWVFDPSGPSFTELPTANGPADVYGHVSLVLHDGRLIVLGGYSGSESALIPFSTVWSLDTTQPTLAWSQLSVSSSSLPTPRRAFAATVLDNGNVLIHGGADAVLQTVYSDGWMLNTASNPMTWSSVGSLTEVGQRYDHFAVAMGSEVLFGFGYGPDGPASASLFVWNSDSEAFVPNYTPQPPTPSNTLPAPTSTSTSGSGSGNGSGGSGGSNPGSDPGSGAGPTSPGGSSGGSGSGASGGDSGGSGSDGGGDGNHTTATVLGVLFGVLGVAGGGVGAAVLLGRHRRSPSVRSQTRFHQLGASDDTDDTLRPLEAAIPVEMMADKAARRPRRADWLPRRGKQLLHNLGIISSRGAGGTSAFPASGAAAATAAYTARRVDMLADEDTRQFGSGGGAGYGVRRDGSGGSAWSLQSVGAALLGRRVRSREPSAGAGAGRRGTPRAEKADPFAELGGEWDGGDAGLRDGPAAYAPWERGRGRERRTPSYATYTTLASGEAPYDDPFEEKPYEGPEDDEGGSAETAGDGARRPHGPYVQTLLPLSTAVHTLSPVTEHTSRTTLFDSARSSREAEPHGQPRASPFDSPQRTSLGSQPEAGPSAGAGAPTQPIRRSDSWWARFARTPWLERRGGGAPPVPLDFRDPNPPPRLRAIAESPAGAAASVARRQVYGAARHGRSASSLRTARTADSAAIERVGGALDVVQRVGTAGSRGSHTTEPSAGSGRASPEAGDGRWHAGGERVGGEDVLVESPVEEEVSPLVEVMSQVASGSQNGSSGAHFASTATTAGHSTATTHASSDVATAGHGSGSGAAYRTSGAAAAGPGASPTPRPPLPAPRGSVAERIRAYEAQQEAHAAAAAAAPVLTRASPEKNTRRREERAARSRGAVQYGLVPRAALYVANPDGGGGVSGSGSGSGSGGG